MKELPEIERQIGTCPNALLTWMRTKCCFHEKINVNFDIQMEFYSTEVVGYTEWVILWKIKANSNHMRRTVNMNATTSNGCQLQIVLFDLPFVTVSHL